MTEAKLQLATELQSRMTALNNTLSILDKLENKRVVVTNYNDGSVVLPNPLNVKVIRVVREYYMSELQEIEKQFDNL